MKIVERVGKIFLGSCMLFTCTLLFVNVILRYFFKSGIFWVEETLRYLIVWIIFIGIAFCVENGSHISVDIINHTINKKYLKYLLILQNCIGILFSSIFLYYSIIYVVATRKSGQVSATMGNLPMYIIYLCLPISMFMYLLYSVRKTFYIITNKDNNHLTEEEYKTL
ncbi:TRAP transporter small permease [Microaceticoccus formicicus]|uniref:TRAP transporter small permease n=1 Tax=Microaceticoccus formicicus TaxID=3118105 RepID=UPI003CD01D02